MSYNQKPAGTGNSGMGAAGPPNGPNNTQQVAKTLAGIQQQMQNFVHVQNALPQSSQADFNTLLQQQRFQNMIKQQQQHLLHQHIQQQMQQQQQQHQQQQNKDRVGTEPLALTRTPAAVDILNKTYQQHHQQHPNGNPNAPNSAALNPFQQQLQVITPNIVQQLQAFQLQMQQHQQQQQQQQHQQQQQQQQQHHSQTQQQAQHHTPPPGPLQSLPQQQLHGQNAQQQKSALTTAAAVAAQLQQRYLSAAVSAQTAAAQATSSSKVGATPPPPPPPLTNQIKPPNLPPSTQITPVPASTGTSQSIAKPTTTNTTITTTAATTSPVKQISPSISLLPSKASATSTATPVAAHQQNKFNINKNSTPATSAVSTPIPAHVQKSPTTNLPSSGNVSLVSSSEISPKTNLNSETSVPTSVTKLSQKMAVPQSAKNTVPTTGLPTNIAAITNKPQSPHGSSTTRQTATNFHSQLPPPKSLQPVAKSAEICVESAAQNNAESANQATVAITSSTQENKSLTTTTITTTKPETTIINKSGKSESVVAVEKTETTKEKGSTVTENSPKLTGPRLSDQLTAVSDEKDAKTSDVLESKDTTKIDHDSERANNNNIAEKGKLTEKEETSIDASHKKLEETGKKQTKDPNEEKLKQTTETTVNASPTDSSTREDAVPNTDVATSKPALDKKFQNALYKKANEESNAVTENQHEVEVHNEKSQATKTQTSSDSKDEHSQKENETKPTKAEKTDSKQESISTSSEITATPLTSHAKVKAPKETETAGGNESTHLKKPSRQLKPSKITSIAVASTSTTVGVDKTPEVIDKLEKIEKPTSSRASREEKRKTQKMPVDIAATTTFTPTTPKETSNAGIDRKSQRHRLKTILYQSPLPELAYITKLSASEASNSPKPMSGEDKLIVFYKNEYMAVRNAEGTFYLCQTMQNVYRTSPRISIRWLSEDAKDSTLYIPDFYDHTDIECVLTTVELKRIDKGHLRLPETEKARIENILKKAIDVEKGLVPRPELTEENPDGLDISLYKDESQIEKKLSGLQTPVSTVRNSRRSVNVGSAKSTSKTNTPSKTAGNKRKPPTSVGGASAAKKSKSPAKKRKPHTKRKTKRGNTSDEENETSEDNASDAEYKPNQKKSNVNTATKSSPRVQRSPLARARAVSPEASTSASARNKNVTSKAATATTSIHSRSERATKRKSGVETVTDSPVPTAKKVTTSNVNNPESTTATQAAKSIITKGKESTNNDAASNKKSATVVSASGSLSNAVPVEKENTTANGNSSQGTSAASRPTRSRK